MFSARLPHLLITSLLGRSIRRAAGRGEVAQKLHRTAAKNGKDEQGISWNESFLVDLAGESELRLVLKRSTILPLGSNSSKTCVPYSGADSSSLGSLPRGVF